MKSPIFGSHYVASSPVIADNQMINLFPEIVETKTGGRAKGVLKLCPGLSLLVTVGTGPIRALHRFGRQLFVVSGNDVYQLISLSTVNHLGSIAAPGPPSAVTLIDNGTQLGIFAGPNGYVWSQAGGFASIALPFLTTNTPITAAQLDGFAVINQPGTNEWFQSALLDMTVWNPLNVASASGDPDNVVAIAQVRREIVLLKESETEFWYNAGTPGFTFARIDGVYLNTGICATRSLARVGEGFIWLASNIEGQGIVVELNGHQLTRVSNHSFETAIQQYPSISDAQAYSYQQHGHEFYVLSFPTGDATWVYDKAASRQAEEPMWHQRASWDGANFHRHPAQCGVSMNLASSTGVAGAVVGDDTNGNLYAFDFNNFTDNGTVRRWLRTWRALAQPSNEPVSFMELRLDMLTGVGIADGGFDPQVKLRWSDDNGYTFSNTVSASAGKLNETARRVVFRRLGATRRNSGLDRLFEISSTDGFPVVIAAADLEVA